MSIISVKKTAFTPLSFCLEVGIFCRSQRCTVNLWYIIKQKQNIILFTFLLYHKQSGLSTHKLPDIQSDYLFILHNWFVSNFLFILKKIIHGNQYITQITECQYNPVVSVICKNFAYCKFFICHLTLSKELMVHQYLIVQIMWMLFWLNICVRDGDLQISLTPIYFTLHIL